MGEWRVARWSLKKQEGKKEVREKSSEVVGEGEQEKENKKLQVEGEQEKNQGVIPKMGLLSERVEREKRR